MKTFNICIIRVYVIIILFISSSCNGQPDTSAKNERAPVVAGKFYPANPAELKSQLSEFYGKFTKTEANSNIAAIIVPHAGYVFSGEVDASAYVYLPEDADYSRIFLIGTSHHTYLNGASIYNKGNYRTPLGTVNVDIELANKLIAENSLFNYLSDAHSKEHSLEVQLPFLQYKLKNDIKIVPIIIGTQAAKDCKKIAKILQPYFTNENLFIISSDFSHYPNFTDANKVDKATAEAIITNSTEVFLQAIDNNASQEIPGLATSCCGWSSVLTLLHLSSNASDINIKHIKYQNSGDTQYGDKQRVVGYHSFLFLRDAKSKQSASFLLSPEEKVELLKIARNTIEATLSNKEPYKIDISTLSNTLKAQCGAFVTLNKNNSLRGCIGRFSVDQPLYEVVQQMAIASALYDHRFPEVQINEMKEIDIEISVLTPLNKISSIDEFVLGKHGIYIKKGNRTGTFLPQVAHSTKWNTDEFLGHCAQDKAGIGWNGWKDKDVELYTYEAIVFDEKELIHTKK
ncbi:MAG: AmmeMemoRadiSam system protein B [Salinivirgaceae bacterium]|nr:AmmeMemoRadiSam system protein B [Salinivirgaceae bacterium]